MMKIGTIYSAATTSYVKNSNFTNRFTPTIKLRGILEKNELEMN